MKPLYYVILYRPRGSKTWTPAAFGYNDWPADYAHHRLMDTDPLIGNFFATQDKAIRMVRRLLKRRNRCYLEAGKWVPTEFATGAVMFNEEVK